MFRAVFVLQEIPTSPFRVKVDPSHDASKVKAEGPGLNKTGEGWVEMVWPVLKREGCVATAGLSTAGAQRRSTAGYSGAGARHLALDRLGRYRMFLGESVCA